MARTSVKSTYALDVETIRKLERVAARWRVLAAAIVGDPEPFPAQDPVQATELFNGSGRRRGSFIDWMIPATAIRSAARLAHPRMEWDGIIGRAVYEGDPTPFWRFLKFGEFVYVGHGATFSLGSYRIVAA